MTLTVLQYRTTLEPKLAAAEVTLGIVPPVVATPTTYAMLRRNWGPRMAVIIWQALLQGRTNAVKSLRDEIFSWTNQLANERDT